MAIIKTLAFQADMKQISSPTILEAIADGAVYDGRILQTNYPLTPILGRLYPILSTPKSYLIRHERLKELYGDNITPYKPKRFQTRTMVPDVDALGDMDNLRLLRNRSGWKSSIGPSIKVLDNNRTDSISKDSKKLSGNAKHRAEDGGGTLLWRKIINIEVDSDKDREKREHCGSTKSMKNREHENCTKPENIDAGQMRHGKSDVKTERTVTDDIRVKTTTPDGKLKGCDPIKTSNRSKGYHLLRRVPKTQMSRPLKDMLHQKSRYVKWIPPPLLPSLRKVSSVSKRDMDYRSRDKSQETSMRGSNLSFAGIAKRNEIKEVQNLPLLPHCSSSSLL